MGVGGGGRRSLDNRYVAGGAGTTGAGPGLFMLYRDNVDTQRREAICPPLIYADEYIFGTALCFVSFSEGSVDPLVPGRSHLK